MIEHRDSADGRRLAPRVSVVIPTFGRAKLILETIDSVLAQTMTRHEVIVIDDGSPDDTAGVLAPLVANGRIDYVRQPNQGISAARNAGIERARGEYVALLDDDDLWPPDKLDWQTRFLDDHADVAVVGGTLQTIDGRGASTGRDRHHPDITFESLFLGNPFWSPGQTLIRAALLKDLGGMNGSIWGADDWDLWFRVAKISRLVMVDRLALLYRMHDGNASNQTGRLLEGARRTLESHLRDASATDRPALRRSANETLYTVFASKLARRAGDQFRAGRPVGAASAMKGVLPFIRAAGFDRSLVVALARDFLGR